MKTLKEFLIPTVILSVICLIATFLLGMTNSVTAPKIEQLAIETELASRKTVFPDATNFGEETSPEEGVSVVAALDESGATIGYVVVNTAKGYGGDISVMTGITADGKVTGVNILSHGETAGLGANATNESFRDQFKGLVQGITVSKDKAGDNSIDALTGATITSRAVVEAVNSAIQTAGGENIG
ncbi:MAG: RnfABCDGE type electron transport complex subunit G [Ruminococcaceae bacterium]|nr:RnfABCDGE type electron transport complex subunit G [Oscillospiraceae bacterium]